MTFSGTGEPFRVRPIATFGVPTAGGRTPKATASGTGGAGPDRTCDAKARSGDACTEAALWSGGRLQIAPTFQRSAHRPYISADRKSAPTSQPSAHRPYISAECKSPLQFYCKNVSHARSKVLRRCQSGSCAIGLTSTNPPAGQLRATSTASSSPGTSMTA